MLELRLGDILIKAGVIDAVGIQQGVEHASSSGQRLGSALIDLKLVSTDVVASALGKQQGVTPANEKTFGQLEAAQLSLVRPADAHRLCAIPIGIMRSTQELAVAMRDPQNLDALDELRAITGKSIRAAVASERRLRRALSEHYGAAAASQAAGFELDLATPPPLVDERPRRKEPTAAPYAAEEVPPASGHEATASGLAFLGSGKGIAIAVAAAVVLIVGFRFAKKLLEPDRGTPVYDAHEAKHVGLRLDFPDNGWHHLEDESKTQAGVSMRMSHFYRGSDPEVPDLALLVLTIKGRFPPSLSESQFVSFVRDMKMDMAQTATEGDFKFGGLDCDRSTRTSELVADCIGQGSYKDILYDIDGSFWIDRSTFVFLVIFTLGEPHETAAEIADIRDSVRML